METVSTENLLSYPIKLKLGTIVGYVKQIMNIPLFFLKFILRTCSREMIDIYSSFDVKQTSTLAFSRTPSKQELSYFACL